MEKIDLTKLTFCIPVRIESVYRGKNLTTLLKYLDKHFHTNYIVVEADTNPKFDRRIQIKNLDYFFVPDRDTSFYRTKYINRMLCLAETPYAAIWSTDAIAPVSQIVSAYNILQEDKATIVYPFSGIYYEVNESVTDFFCKDCDIKKIDFPYLSKPLVNGYYAAGGAYMVNIPEYNRSGGENQHFSDSGFDEGERLARLQILGKGIEKVDGSLYHLYHTRNSGNRLSDIDTVIGMKQEFCKVCGMTSSELQDYIHTWEWL